MYKARVDATHFFPRTGSHSTKGSRRGYSNEPNVGIGVLALQKEEERRQNAAKRIKQIDGMLVNLPNCLERTRLCREKCSLQILVNQIRPKKKLPTLGSYFMEVAQETLPAYQFKLVLARAKVRMDMVERAATTGARSAEE